jgi:hypothetical protein
MEITLPIDEDWEVRVLVAPDLSTVVIYNVQTDDEIRLEGSWDRLHLLGTVITGDLKALHGDTEVTANGRNPDAHDPGCWATPIADRPPGAHHHMDDCRCEAGNPNATLDEIDAKIANLQQMLTEHREEADEEARYPDDMVTGDWVRFPPQRTWRRIDGVNETGAPHHNREIVYTFGGTQYHQSVRAGMRYPYTTEANMAKVDE